MGYLLGLPLEPGSDEVLVVEVDSGDVPGDLVLASPDPAQAAARAGQTLEEALKRLEPSLQKVVGMFKKMSPDQATVEFGLKVGGETGLIVAKGTAEANLTVTMSWGKQNGA